MALTGISLADFRNHADTTLRGAKTLNLLVGANGAGKTNVLEALSLLAPGRGLRRASPPTMARQGGTGGFAVGASLAGEGEVRLGTLTRPDAPARRLLSVNGAAASGAQIAEWLSVGWLTPAMDQLFAAPPGERRRYLDRLALALTPGHAVHALRYERALRERNRLLGGDRPPEPGWLNAIEAQMADAGSLLAQGRGALVDALMGEVVRHGEDPFPRPALTYAPGGPVGRDELSQALHDGRTRDRTAGRTLTGPHRDDLDVQYAAKRMPAAASSTGEQKALLVAITLAHAALAAKGRPALLLLDEVAAHLDPARRAALFARLADSGTQVWMTGTELAPFAAVAPDAAVWEIASGAAMPL
ncbi:DNA replication/repair protein RecF [Qipengyuania sediminis]|uniref:DNA replication/repair protein RecF n=1 Tax=Qipengyuania sediminis TaxID=1532023 RepID=UPI001059565A|nr:DNA replication/repair protein RecF [Qipengyuania sediminis]